MSDHYESRKQRCKCYVLFTWGDFANIWSSTVIILHINTTRLCCTIRPCCMSSVFSHRMQGIFGGNIWDSVAQDSVQLLLQQHECMLKVCQLQGMQINLIGSTLTPHSGGWREGSTELAKLVFKLKHAQCNKSLFLVVRWLTRRQGDKETRRGQWKACTSNPVRPLMWSPTAFLSSDWCNVGWIRGQQSGWKIGCAAAGLKEV